MAKMLPRATRKSRPATAFIVPYVFSRPVASIMNSRCIASFLSIRLRGATTTAYIVRTTAYTIHCARIAVKRLEARRMNDEDERQNEIELPASIEAAWGLRER